jgi:serine/threonine-protein kinase SRPK3
LKFNTYVALKVQKSAKNYLEAAYDEVEILDVIAKNAENSEWIKSLIYYHKDDPESLKIGAISEHCHNVMLLNSFQYYGPNGMHFVMVFEILGVNLLEIMKRFDYKGIPIPLVRRIARQILMGLDYLHRICRIIHTDLKPENVIVCLTKNELEEIIRRGQLSTINKTIRTLDVQSNFLL